MSYALDEVSLNQPSDAGIGVIVGCKGGIGHAVLTLLEQRKSFDTIVGLSRDSLPPLDLLSEKSIADAARFVGSLSATVRLIVVCTGLLYDEEHSPERGIRHLDPNGMAKAFAINTIGPALIMKHFLPLLPRSGKSVFAVLSARVGSIGDNQLGGWYSYRASKAALNQLVRTASIELRRAKPEAICVSLHPGTVDTQLSAPFARVGLDVQAPALAADRLVAVMEGLSAQDSGNFVDYRGDTVPW